MEKKTRPKPHIMELIAGAPWREAVTYRNTWPHEYVLSRKDGQRELLELVCSRFRAGEGVAGTFFGRPNAYLFIGDYKYWLMTHWDAVNLDDEQGLRPESCAPVSRPARLRHSVGRYR